MPEKKLRELGDEIKTITTDNPLSREKLARLDSRVEAYLSAEDREPHTGTLLDELRDAAKHFEVSHPRLTDLVNQVTTSLSNMGI